MQPRVTIGADSESRTMLRPYKLKQAELLKGSHMHTPFSVHTQLLFTAEQPGVQVNPFKT